MLDAMRIIIVEKDFDAALGLERTLNSLGYYCVLPVSSFQEACNLSEFGGRGFDLALVNIKQFRFDALKASLLGRKLHAVSSVLYGGAGFEWGEMFPWIVERIENTPSMNFLEMHLRKVEAMSMAVLKRSRGLDANSGCGLGVI